MTDGFMALGFVEFVEFQGSCDRAVHGPGVCSVCRVSGFLRPSGS